MFRTDFCAAFGDVAIADAIRIFYTARSPILCRGVLFPVRGVNEKRAPSENFLYRIMRHAAHDTHLLLGTFD